MTVDGGGRRTPEMLATLLGAAIALSPTAQATEPLCRPSPPEPPLTRIQVYQELRALYGLRTDASYIRRLIRRGAFTRGTVDFERFPATAREQRYVELRDRLDLGGRARRYLSRRPGIDGGTSIEDDFPRDPYLLVRLTRDRSVHTRALRRLARFPRLLRTKAVALSLRHMDRLAARIARAGADRDGIRVTSAEPDIGTNTVRVFVITKRTDAARYFRARYGPRVRTRVVATELYSLRCRPLHDYVPDGARLTIGWEGGGGVTLDHIEVAEYDDRVEIGVVVQSYNGPQTAESRRVDAVVELSRPLGDREVVDATSGLVVPRRAREPRQPLRAP